MRIYVAHDLSDRGLALELIFLLREIGHEVTDPVDPGSSAKAIDNADLFIACVSSRTTNVYFELGIAAGQRKESLVIARSETDVAPGAARLPCVVVGESIEPHRVAIQRAIERASKQVRAATVDDAVENETTLQRRVAEWFMSQGATVEREAGGGRYDIVARMPDGKMIVADVRADRSPFRVSLEPVRSLREAMSFYGAQQALLFTSGSMTRAAAELAASQGVSVANPELLFNSGSFAEFAKQLAPFDSSEHGHIPGQTLGYWFGPKEVLPIGPIGNPTGAVLALDPSWRAVDEAVALDLVRVDYEWRVLSELGRYTYSHSEGMLRGEEWRFVLAEDQWPQTYVASLADSIQPQHLHLRYGPEAARRARPDAPAIQLRLRRQTG